MLMRLEHSTRKVLAGKPPALLDFTKARYETLPAVTVFMAQQHRHVSAFVFYLQNTDGIFPNAAIAKKLGEVMGDSSKDISKKADK